MVDVIQVDIATGERIERDFTPEELAQRAKDQAAAEAEAQAQADALAAKETAKVSALAKLEALGLTHDEAVAIAGV
jgi:hypothetical protein